MIGGGQGQPFYFVKLFVSHIMRPPSFFSEYLPWQRRRFGGVSAKRDRERRRGERRDGRRRGGSDGC